MRGSNNNNYLRQNSKQQADSSFVVQQDGIINKTEKAAKSGSYNAFSILGVPLLTAKVDS
jgi:hypothetical protein